jgi:DNA-binding CsgD family transcriptional regulator
MKGSQLRADYISIIEAIYSVDQPAEAWIKQILSAAAPALDEGAGVGGVLYQIRDGSPLDLITGVGLPAGWLEEGMVLHATPELHDDLKRIYGTILCGDVMDFARLADNFNIVGESYKEWNIHGDILLNGCDVSGKGACLHVFSHKPCKLSQARWKLLAQLSTHLATGYRLHQRLVAANANAPIEAVLTPRGRIEHAEPAAKSSEARASLKEAIEQRRWSQSRARTSEPERAVGFWRGLVTGRWTLVDRYESGGQRYILARENTPRGREALALSGRENQVVALASLGRNNKMIAYELDLAHATVRVLMARAAKKLGAQSRQDLVSRFHERAGSAASH